MGNIHQAISLGQWQSAARAASLDLQHAGPITMLMEQSGKIDHVRQKQ
jgi:hypothetical protein